MDMEQTIRELDRLGVTFAVTHEGPSGTESVGVTAEQLAAYVRDPQAWLARHYGVSRIEWMDWQRDRYHVYCSGFTSTGRPCRNTVAGGTGVGAKRWAELQGSKCSVHQERG